MSDSCKGCAEEGTCTSGTCPSAQDPIDARKYNKVKNVIAIMSGKGGVGKSSVTGMLAVSLARQGYKVGILDADITGPSIPMIFGFNEKAKLVEDIVTPPKSAGGIKVISLNLVLGQEDAPVIWRGPIIAQLVTQFWQNVLWGVLDYLLIDLPPGTGDVPLTVLQSMPVNGIVIVSSPQQLAGMIVRKAVNMAKKMNAPIYGLIENMAYLDCPDCQHRLEIFGPSRGEEEAKRMEIPYLGQLPLDPALASLSDAGKIEEYQSEAFEQIAKKLTSGIEV